MNNNKRPLTQPQQLRVGRHGGGPMGGRRIKEKPKNLSKTLQNLLRYIGKNKGVLIALLIIMSIVTLLELLGPLLQGKAIDTIKFMNGHLKVNMQSLTEILIAMATIFIFNSVMNYVQGVLAARLSQKTVYLMRCDLFEKISHLPISYTDCHKHGDIMSRMTNDVENVSNAVAQSIASLLSSVLTFCGAVFFMVRCNLWVTFIAFVTVPITMLLTTNLAKFMRKYFVRQQQLLGALNGEVEEMVIGYKTVVAYGKEKKAVSEFSQTSDELKKVSIKSKVWGSVMGPCMNLLGNLQYILVAGFGIWFFTKGTMSIGNIQSMLQYSKKFNRPINEIANQYSIILTALAGAERIFEIINSADETDTGEKKAIGGNITFNNVSFGYFKNEPVLKSLNLNIKKGQKIALVGATGSGKTTIVNLLTRFYEINGGEVLINGVNIKEVPKNELRSLIGIVLQDTVLFKDSIKNNIKYGRLDVKDEEIKKAAHLARADRFIEMLPQGYETLLSESGSNLSEGQRQLLSIARAVLKDPEILILDEATSSVDTRTEMQIQKAMVTLMEGRTSIIIAHRLSTIRDADRIVVLSNGEIVEQGSHDELLSTHGEYYKLYQNQFAGIAT